MAKSRIKNGNHNGHYTLDSIYHWIVEYKIFHDGNSPSLAEMMQRFHIPSKSTASRKLAELERGGFIQRNGGAKRGIEIVGAQWVPPARV